MTPGGSPSTSRLVLIGWRAGSLVALWLLVGCAAPPHIVPLPGAGLVLGPREGVITASHGGVVIQARPSSWQGSPWDLASYVTPFHVGLANDSVERLAYGYAGFRLFDEHRFQYPALPPVEVARRYLGLAEGSVQVAGVGVEVPAGRRHPRARSAWGWGLGAGWGGPWGWPGSWWDPWPTPSMSDVFAQALAEGPLEGGARTEGFVYFPRLRPGVTRLMLEFHHRLGETPGLLVLPFGVEPRALLVPAVRGAVA